MSMSDAFSPRPVQKLRDLPLRWIDMAMSLAWKGATRLLRLMPERAAFACAALAGDVVYATLPSFRGPLTEEARHLLGRAAPVDEARAKTLARLALRGYFQRQVELVRWGDMTGDDFARLVDVKGLEHLDAALADGRGAVLLTAHYGSFLMGPIALSYRGYDVSQVIGPPKLHPKWRFQRDIHAYREAVSAKFPLRFLVAANTLKSVLRALGGGGAVVLAFDGREGAGWIEADFLGHKATFAPTVFRIAAQTGAPVLPFFLVSQPNGRHTAEIEPAFEMPRTADGSPDVEAAVRGFARILERRVLAAPELFLTTVVSQRRRFRSGQGPRELYPPAEAPGPGEGRP